MKHGICTFVFVGLVTGMLAQEIPFLTEEEYTWLVNEISGDAAYEHIRYFTQFHRPRGGAPGLMEVAKYVEQKAHQFGLEDVKLIRQKATSTPWWNKYGELWLVKPFSQLIASTLQTPVHLADYSRSTHLEAEIVFVGRGTQEKDYQDKQVKEKIVLAYGSPSGVMKEAVWKRGARGILSYPDPSAPETRSLVQADQILTHPDQILWLRVPVKSEEGQEGTFAFSLSARQGKELRDLLKREGSITVKVDIESEFGEENWQVMVEAFIRGTDVDDQDIVLTGHLQEEKFSANDDASGCANVLEIARAVKKLIDQGKLKRARRNIRFWWVTEISSQRQYFADHPEAHRSMLANINQDMVGADQSQDILRAQNMTRVPFSRFHFLNDVAESWMEFTMESNKGNLAILRAGSIRGGSLYPRPILSRLGSRHRFNADIIPFHNSTDHMTFNEAPIGVAAISFTNWPDHYIHTTDDDLWNIDRTQLQRNAFTVAAIAYTLAQADSYSFDSIASEVLGRAIKRLGEDFRLALEWQEENEDNFYLALHQVEEAYAREKRALDSLEAISETPKNQSRLELLFDQLKVAHEALGNFLTENFRLLYDKEPPVEKLSEVEQELQHVVPKLAAGPAEFLDGRGKIRAVPKLHSLMAFEILNFVDGKRSGLEIYRAVLAEARRAGKHYYGEVNPGMVRKYLQNVKEVGLISF
ncbi:MAG: M28 family peptidase [Acidobacteriota bacterium]